MKRLSPKQFEFCHHIACDGMSMSDAYRCAYASNTDNQATVHRNAWAEYNKPHIQGYIAELRQVVRLERVMSRVETLETLTDIARHAVRPNSNHPDNGIRIRAIHELNKMLGYDDQQQTISIPNIQVRFGDVREQVLENLKAKHGKQNIG